MSQLNQVNYGTEGLHMCTKEHYRWQVKQSLDCQISRKSMKAFAKGVHKEKNVKKTFPSNESKDKGILEILHSDVCGPMSSSSLTGYVYYVSFIDYFSCKTWIYLLKGKSEFFSKFKEYKDLVEN